MELTTAKLGHRRSKPNKRQKAFCEALVRNGGQKAKAYQEAYGVDWDTARAASARAMKFPSVVATVGELLEKQGLPREMFVKKLGQLLEATKDGESDNATQFNSMKLGMELHGMIQKQPENVTLTQVNYNVDIDKLNGALEKLGKLSKALELSECPDGEIHTIDVTEEPQ